MGGKISTKKTMSDVKKDLYKQVCTNARNLLREKTGQNLPDAAELDDIMYPLAQWKFKDEFTFDFEKDSLMYKFKNLPDALPGTVTPVAQLCSITEGSDVDGFIDTVLLSKVDLPAWMSGNAKGALKTLAGRLTSQDTFLQCRFDGYQQSFDGVREDEDSWKAKAVIVYMTGSLLEDDLQANITIVYFLAIYYKALSPTQTVRNLIRDVAFNTARAYTSCNTPIILISDLTAALRSYGIQAFVNHFGFEHKSTKPPDYDPHASSPLNTSNNHTFYFPDMVIGDLKETVNGLLFQGFNIPEKYPSIEEKALNEITTHIKEIVRDPTSGAWSDTFISKTYSPLDPTLNPVRLNVVAIHFYDHKTAENQVAVSNTYIFCLGMIWEVLSPEKILTQDIFRMMVNQLRRHLQDGNESLTDVDELKTVLLKYAKKQFSEHFQFDYNGDKSVPPDKISNGRVRGFEELGAFQVYPVQSEDITNWMDVALFRRDSNKFPRYCNSKIYDDLKNDLIYYTKNFPQNSMWRSNNQDRTYDSEEEDVPGYKGKPNPNQTSGQSIKVSTTYVSGLGDMSEQGVHKQMPFVYVLMVCRSTQEGSW